MKKHGWKHADRLVCCGLTANEQRSIARTWEWQSRMRLNRRWDVMCELYGWRRGCGLGKGKEAFDEWVKAKHQYEAECEKNVEWLV
jgi:hypothetical protein